MDCNLYHQLKSLLNIAFNTIVGLQHSSSQLAAASLPEPSMTLGQPDGAVPKREWLSSSTFLEYLSHTEAQEIIEQFESIPRPEYLPVFWTGIPRERAQEWADARGMSTLTTMMGPLMNTAHIRYKRSSKRSKLWSRYMKGASIVFSLYANGADTITVVTIPPPLQLADLRPGCTFLSLEEPILKGLHDVKIKFVHPMVGGAEDFTYEVWPKDHTTEWTERFAAVAFTFRHWGNLVVRTKSAALDLANKGKSAKNMAKVASSRATEQVKRPSIVLKKKSEGNLNEAQKASNMAETEKARKLKKDEKAKNIAEAETVREMKRVEKANNIAKVESARRLKQVKKKAENIAKAGNARKLK